MTQWPQPEVKKIPPEGHYKFRLNREPELKKFFYKDKDGNEREGRRLVVYAIGINEYGEFSVVDAFVPWEQRYADLCKALGVEHGRDINMGGSFFEADIKHEPRKDKPGEIWPRIANIVVPGDEPTEEAGNIDEGDDIPF